MSTSDRWPSVAECAALIAAWLPEAFEISVSLDGDGIPAAVIDLPELMTPVVWQASSHMIVYPHPHEDNKSSPAAQMLWDERWAALYAGRPNRPAVVWRWRTSVQA
jgi:hypothetical protein